MVRSALLRVSNHESVAILRDGASRLLQSERECAHPGMRTALAAVGDTHPSLMVRRRAAPSRTIFAGARRQVTMR
jgi:hypothetical protein